MFHVLGTPTESTWPDMCKLPSYAGPYQPIHEGALDSRGSLPLVFFTSHSLVKLFSPWRWCAVAAVDLAQSYPRLGRTGADLLLQLLQYDPAKRLSAEVALEHTYFADIPNEVAALSEERRAPAV